MGQSLRAATVLSTLLIPDDAALAADPSVAAYNTDRITQLCIRNLPMAGVFEQYEAAVPKDARVAVAFLADDYEYPVFGEGLTRTIRPVTELIGHNDVWWNNMQFLIYRGGLVSPAAGDTLLGYSDNGRQYYLRDMRPGAPGDPHN